MLRATMKYGAVSAKVMALYGRLLSPEEWRKLCDCSSVGDIILFLKNHSGWSDVFSSTSPNAGVEAVSEAAESALWKEYEKLYKFAYLEDKRFLDFFLFRAEMEHILSALGRLCSAGDKGVKTNVSDFIIKHSSVNSEQLDSSTDFKGLQEAIKGSIFEQPLTLLPINKESGLPDYAQASVLLENHYYKSVFSYVTKKYTGMGKAKLAETVGAQADLINIVSLLRLHKYFPGSLGSAQEMLIPVYYRLTPSLAKQLRLASDETEALALLKKSPCGRYLAQSDGERPEALYNKAMEAFCIKLIKSPSPNICTPQAYLILKEMECRRLARVAQAVSYGLNPQDSL